jgi:hypothetical protein
MAYPPHQHQTHHAHRQRLRTARIHGIPLVMAMGVIGHLFSVVGDPDGPYPSGIHHWLNLSVLMAVALGVCALRRWRHRSRSWPTSVADLGWSCAFWLLLLLGGMYGGWIMGISI